MEVARSGSCMILRLAHGEDILESVKSATEKEKHTMMITAGLGMIVGFELGYFDRGTYLKKSFSEPHELLSMQGSVSGEGDNRIHIHVTVADKEHEAFGGHLLGGKVWMSNEISLLLLEGVRSHRAVDPELKVGVLHLKS